MYYYAIELQHKKNPKIHSLIIDNCQFEPYIAQKFYINFFQKDKKYKVKNVNSLTEEQFTNIGGRNIFEALMVLDIRYKKYKKERRKQIIRKILSRLRGD